MTSTHIPTLLIAAFHAILFLQSGLDKVTDYRGNLAYFRDHFKNSLLAPVVGLLMPVITLLEVSTGAVAAWSCVQLVLGKGPEAAFWAAVLAAVSLLGLFLGQRIAKDYAGAAGLVPYFLVALAGVLLSY